MQELYVVRIGLLQTLLGILCTPERRRLSLGEDYRGRVSERDHQTQVQEHTAVLSSSVHSSVLLHPYTLTSVFR